MPVSNFLSDVLLLLPKSARFVHLSFGFQVFPQKAVGRNKVGKPGWPGSVTKTSSDAPGKHGLQTIY
jgi:hypothetical protein